jgi:diguanylate cyclase (GGDEF)-like protein
MSLQTLHPSYDGSGVALSVIIAIYASYVALDLARRVRDKDRESVVLWTAGGALVMGTGIWSMHFVGMLAMGLPITITYDPLLTLVSWLVAVSVSLISLLLAARDRLARSAWLVGALAMGAGICGMHYVGMMAMMLTPVILWNVPLVGLSVVIAVLASAIALRVFFAMRRLNGVRAYLVQGVAALILGTAIVGMHYTGMAAASFPAGAFCQTTNGIGGHNLGTMVVFASLIMLSITLFTSMVDARQQVRAITMAQSLEQANLRLQDANAELQWMAFRDPLTGLPNRALLEDRLDGALNRISRQANYPGKRTVTKLAVVFIDLDGFKPINDSYGHATGDLVLRQVAGRLTDLIREIDTAARIGGDEFLVLLEEVHGVTDAVGFADRIVRSLAVPLQIADRELALSCSIGIAIFPDHAPRDRLIGSADAAMYAAKHNGGNSYAVYEPHMQSGATDQMEMQQALRGAIARQELQLHYQPKIDGRLGHVAGLEALLRWRNSSLGLVLPDVFIPLAERFGLIIAIGDWVIEAVCQQLARWQREGRCVQVAINLSGYQLRQSDLAERMRHLCANYSVAPGQLTCEVTESVAMEDTASTQRVLRQLSELGVSLSIDDFGTGYSSLAYLRQLRVQQLKIDRSFIRDLDSSADARAVVDAVIRLAHSLGLRVVAEGVETSAQHAALIALDCDELQGYYLAKPMTADALGASGLLDVPTPL